MQNRLSRYGAAALLLQALLVSACDSDSSTTRSDEAPVAENVASGPDAGAKAEAQGPEQLVLAFGDSLYAGYGLQPGQSLPDALQAKLRAEGLNATFVNAAVSGDTTAAGRQRLAFVLDNLDRKPDLVILGLGGNDMLRQIPPAETRANMEAMLQEIRRRGIPVMLTGMVAAPNLGPDYAAGFNRIWPELAREYDAELYPFILEGVVVDPALMLPDRIHPNAEGVERISTRMAPLVIAQLQDED